MRCIICDSTEWENVDQYRIKKSNMSVCKNCGFISYPDVTKEYLEKYYKKEYRKPPSISNLYTGQRKINYHAEFLSDTLKKWKESGKEDPVICDCGAAFGMFLHWFRGNFPKSKLYGTELTISYRRNAYHEFGIKLDEKFDDSIKYDLISSYKVAEHLYDADKEVRKYVQSLKDDGLLYISVPTWFNVLENSGVGGFDIEYYYHKNHLNVWTKEHFESMLKKCGAEIIKENHSAYGNTYLCKRNDALIDSFSPHKESIDVIKSNLEKVYNASMAFMGNDFAKALEYWPNFPSAYVNFYETNRAKFHEEGFDWIEKNVIEKALNIIPNNGEIYLWAANLYMRYDRFDDALKFLEQCVKLKPGYVQGFISISQCYRQMANRAEDDETRYKLISNARSVARHTRDISLQSQQEMTNWIFNDNANIPMEGENG